jgi:hypothetical protein
MSRKASLRAELWHNRLHGKPLTVGMMRQFVKDLEGFPENTEIIMRDQEGAYRVFSAEIPLPLPDKGFPLIKTTDEAF